MNVCVDNRNLKLPNFVDRVPLIYTTNKKLIADEDIMNYIKSKIESYSLQPYSLTGMTAGGLSESFSFLNNEEEYSAARNFIFIGSEQRINAPDENEHGKGGGRDNAKDLERYLADRDTDIKKIFGNGQQAMRI
jgi:hypothetical protein